MKAEFKKALERVLVYEGGKVDDPRDPGGRTNQGVTQAVYDVWRKSEGLPRKDVYKMTSTERDAIYKRRYWDVVEGDALPAGIGFILFDGAVNSGPVQSVKWLQRALGTRYTGRVDGQMGMVTLQAVKETNDHDALVAAICERRLLFLKNLRTWPTFKGGWSRRVANVLATGQAWAMGSVGPAVEYSPGMEAKAKIEDAKHMPVKAPADLTSGAGATITVGSQSAVSTIDSTKAQLQDFANVELVQKVLLALTVIGIALTLAGIAWRTIQKVRENKRKDELNLNPDPVRE